MRELRRRLQGEGRDFFSGEAPIFVGRAPGRLDVMGGGGRLFRGGSAGKLHCRRRPLGGLHPGHLLHPAGQRPAAPPGDRGQRIHLERGADGGGSRLLRRPGGSSHVGGRGCLRLRPRRPPACPPLPDGRAPKGLFPLVDRDGIAKPTIQIIVGEALAAGIEEEVYRRHFQGLDADEVRYFAGRDWVQAQSEWLRQAGERLTFVAQPRPEGYGHAVFCARDFAAGEPCLVMLGDHVYISHRERPCARQLVDVFERFGSSVSAVNRVGEEALPYFGMVRGRLVPGETDVYEAQEIVEKPSADYARTHLRAEGMSEGQYLCFFGLHALSPGIFDCLAEAVQRGRNQRGEVELTAAQEALRQRERYLAFAVDGQRYDTGIPRGLVETQLALARHSALWPEVEAGLGLPGRA